MAQTYFKNEIHTQSSKTKSTYNYKKHSKKSEMKHLTDSNSSDAHRTQENHSKNFIHVLKKSSTMQLGRHCNWEDIEESLVKSTFSQGMANSQIQMDLLSEYRDPPETLNYALMRERGHENQQRISKTHAQIPQGSEKSIIQRTRQQSTRRSILPTPPNNNKVLD